MAGAARSGTAIGMIGMTIFASAFVTPFLIPYVLNTSSWQVVWALIGVASLVAVPLSPGEKAKD
jgi:MFS family permease